MDSNIESAVAFFPDIEMGLTLKEAIEIAHKEALKWNKAAMLYNGSSVDRDENANRNGWQKKTLEHPIWHTR